MPPKKKHTRNAFYWFMQDIIPDLRREGRVFPNGLQDVVPVATPRWKALSDTERERYENKAKLEKKRARQSGSGRLDNLGNVIGERGNEQADLERRRLKEKKWVSCHWPKGDDIKDVKFYFISFEYLCETEEGDFLPAEVGLIEWSLNQGISKTLHQFIDPGSIPLGYRYTCQSHSDDTHQIPVSGFELADSNYRGLWIRMENFVNPNGEKEEYPPIFFLGNERKTVEYCVDWLHAHACLGVPNCLHRLFILENMIVELYAHKLAGDSTPPPTRSAVVEMLTTSVFDYEANTRCAWHEEQQVRYCALGTVKRFAFALSDALSSIYDFELTPSHLPTRSADTAVAYTIIPPSAIQLDRTPVRGRGPRGRGSGDRDACYRDAREHGRVDSDATGWVPSKASSNAWSAGQQREQRVAPPSPWGRPNVDEDYSASESMSEWPSLGGGSAGGTFAGRVQAPAPNELPVCGWQPKREGDNEEQIYNRPTLGQAVQQKQDSRPTLGEAVQQKQDSRPTLGQAMKQKQDSRPTLGQAMKQKQDSRPTLGQAVQQKQDSRPTLGQAVQQKQDSRPTLGQAVQQKQDSRPTLGEAVQQKQDSRPTLGQAVHQTGQIQPPVTQQQQVCGRGMGILTPGMWPGQTQRPGMMPHNPPARNPWGAPPGQQAATVNPLAGLGRGRGLFTPVPSQGTRPNGLQQPSQQEITRPPPGFGLGISDQFASLGVQQGGPH